MVLTVLAQVVKEVDLALDLPRELLGLQVATSALLALYDWIALHFSIVGRFIKLINPYCCLDYKVLLNCHIIREIECGKHQFVS